MRGRMPGGLAWLLVAATATVLQASSALWAPLMAQDGMRLNRARLIAEKANLQPNVTPFVRVPATGLEDVLFQAKQVLDVGVFGVMYPSVSTREEAEHAVRATRYPQRAGAADFEPSGLRGRNPANATWFWGVRDYSAKAGVWPLDPQGACLDTGVPCAITTNANTVGQRIDKGFRFVTVGSDGGISAGVSNVIELGHAAADRP